MRNPNGYGSVKKLSGKRRRPFAVVITTGFKMSNNTPKIDFLKDILSKDTFALVQEEYNAYKLKQKPVAKQEQKIVGYYATRQEAMIALAEYNKNPYDIDKRNTTFEQVYDILYEQKFSKMKDKAKSAYVASFKKCDELKDIRMVEMRKAHMQKVVDEYADKSKSLQKNLVTLFNAIYTFCLENDICEKNYAEFVDITSEKEAKDKVPFSRAEIELLWNNLEWSHTPAVVKKRSVMHGQKLMDSVLIMIYTGCRINELLSIKTEDVHLEERWIDLRGTKTKAARRIVPIHKKLIPLIEKRMDGEYLLEAEGKQIKYPIYYDTFFEPMCEALELKHTPHECRHSFATYAAASSMNKTLLKKIIGHSAQDLTEDVYTHAFVEDLVKEIDKFNL